MSPPKFPLPPRPMSPLKFAPPPPRPGTLVYGARESCNTTATFVIHPGRGVDDLLMIGIDEHNGEHASRLMVRGGYEGRLMPSHLRWLADKIEKELGNIDAPTNGEYVLNIAGGR
jgi:hypothetical protein